MRRSDDRDGGDQDQDRRTADRQFGRIALTHEDGDRPRIPMLTLESADPDPEAFVDRRAKVWLECNGEPYDFRSLYFVEFMEFGGDLELVSFRCPRCGARHQSLRFL